MKRDNQFDPQLFVGDYRRDNVVSETEKMAEVAKVFGKIIKERTAKTKKRRNNTPLLCF